MAQSAQQWFNFKFLEGKSIKAPEVEKAQITATCFSRNHLILCDADGYIKVFDRAMRSLQTEFRAYTGCITHIKSIPSRNVIATIGDDSEDSSGVGILRLWELEGLEEGAKDFRPEPHTYPLFNAKNTPPSTRVPIRTSFNEELRKNHKLVSREDGAKRSVLSFTTPIVSFDVSEDLTMVAAGLTSGEIVTLRSSAGGAASLVRGSVGRIAMSRLSAPSSDQGASAGSVCFVAFASGRGGAKDNVVSIDNVPYTYLLYVVYEGFAVQWRRDSRGEYLPFPFPMVVAPISPEGCAVNEDGELAIADRANKGRIYFFNNENVTRLSEVEPGVAKICFHRQYLVVLAQDTSRKEARFQLCAYDTTAQIRALADSQASSPSWILSDVGQLVLLHQKEDKANESGVAQRVVRYTELEFSVKLKQLFERECYEVAIRMAKKVDAASGTNNEQMNIQKRYGEHLFKKGKYEEAINQYIKTIGGSVEPSYVIRQFLDAQRIKYLTKYLEELHSDKHKIANKNHTTLLLNCFTKMNEREKLKEFINRSDIRFDAHNAIKVCRQAGYYDEATQLAEKYQLHNEYVKIQLDNLQDPTRALRFIQSLPVNLAESIFLDHGKQLVALEPEATTDLLIKLCTKWVSANRRLQGDTNSRFNRAGGGGAQGLSSPTHKKGGEGVQKPEERSFAYEFVHVFVDAPYYMLRFLEGVANCEVKGGGGRRIIDEDFSDPQSELATKQRVVYHTLIELYLTRDLRRSAKPADVREDGLDDSAAASGDSSAKHTDPNVTSPITPAAVSKSSLATPSYLSQLDLAYAIISNYPERYDHYHVLALVQQHDFERGILFMLQMLKLHEEVVAHYAKSFERKDLPVAHRLEAKDRLIEACKGKGALESTTRQKEKESDQQNAEAEADRSMWVSLLSILVRSDLDVSDDIRTVLNHIQEKDLLPPVAVIEILGSNPNLQLKTVRHYVLAMLAADEAAIQKNQEVLRSNTEKTAKLHKDLRQLTTTATVFQTSKCSSTRCGAPLDLPAVHFLCKHSYHKRCLNDVLECNQCSAESRRIIQQQRDLEARVDNHDEFFASVADAKADEGFSVVASHFAEGIFSAPALRKEALLVSTAADAFNADSDLQLEAEDDWLGVNELEDPASVEMW